MVVWNLMGLMAFVLQMMMTPEQMAALPEAQRSIYENYAAWATAAFAVAVVTGTAGALLLALGKALALPLLVASLVGVVVQKIHDFVLTDTLSVFGPSAAVMSGLVILLGIALILVAKKGKDNNWLS